MALYVNPPDCSQCVQIRLELGHKATLRTKKTPQGFTHDWEVFIRGPEGTSIQSFVEKVVFYLHKDFAKPKRGKPYPYLLKLSSNCCFSCQGATLYRQRIWLWLLPTSH